MKLPKFDPSLTPLPTLQCWNGSVTDIFKSSIKWHSSHSFYDVIYECSLRICYLSMAAKSLLSIQMDWSKSSAKCSTLLLVKVKMSPSYLVVKNMCFCCNTLTLHKIISFRNIFVCDWACCFPPVNLNVNHNNFRCFAKIFHGCVLRYLTSLLSVCVCVCVCVWVCACVCVCVCVCACACV